MKQLTVLLTATFFCSNLFAQTTGEKLDAYFKAAQKADIFNGSVLVTKDGLVLLQKGYGYKNVEARQDNDVNTIFQIGSVTKQFTAAVILKMVEQGKLNLQEKLSKYYPDFKDGDKITIEHLLTHRSGIWSYTDDETFMRGPVYSPKTEKELMAMFMSKPLEFEPGNKFNYSNSGYVVLGYIIQKVSGKPYEQMVRQLIFEPLQMTHSGFDFANLKTTNKAIGYAGITGVSAQPSLMVDSTVSYAAGSMYTTVNDLLAWDKSLQTEKILSKSSLTNAFTPRLSNYGFGLVVDTVYGYRRISHNGGIPGFLSANSTVPEMGISIIMLSNADNSKIGDLENDVQKILFDKPYTLPESKKEVAVDEENLKQYEGEYELAPHFIITVSLVNGKLKAQATGQPQFDLFAKSNNVFFLKVVEAEIEFMKDANGAVEKLILHQGGQDIPGKKVK